MKESLLTDVFLQAGFFLALSALVIPLLRYFKIPIALGYLFAGIALGPYALGSLSGEFRLLDSISLQETEHVKILAELGIVLLLFIIGLELTPRRLWQMRNLVFGLGGAQVTITAAVIGLIAFLWGNNVQVSILLGLGLALSSTAMIIQWLHEQKLFVTHVGRASFSILLFQDLAVIPILLLMTILSTDIEGNVFQFVSLSLLKMAFTVVAIYMIGKIILKPVFLFANRHGGSEVFVALSLLVIVSCATIASMAGLSMALGAFLAGLLLAETEYRHEISSLILPFKSMLLGIFFFSFGMGINLSFIAEKPFWLFASVIGLMSIKACIIFALCKLWKQTNAVSVESAILLSQAGEFGLLVVGGSLATGLMEDSVGQFMLITIGMTMLVTPIIAILARKVGAVVEARTHERHSYNADNVEKKNQHVVILGYGRIGRAVGENLCKEGMDILGFEKNMQIVHKVRKNSEPVYFGDATKKSTLNAAQLENAVCAVVTIDNAEATSGIVKQLRTINPSIPIVVRAHNADDMEIYASLDNVEAIPEHIIMSNKLSEKVLDQCGAHDDKKEQAAA